MAVFSGFGVAWEIGPFRYDSHLHLRVTTTKQTLKAGSIWRLAEQIHVHTRTRYVSFNVPASATARGRVIVNHTPLPVALFSALRLMIGLCGSSGRIQIATFRLPLFCIRPDEQSPIMSRSAEDSKSEPNHLYDESATWCNHPTIQNSKPHAVLDPIVVLVAFCVAAFIAPLPHCSFGSEFSAIRDKNGTELRAMRCEYGCDSECAERRPAAYLVYLRPHAMSLVGLGRSSVVALAEQSNHGFWIMLYQIDATPGCDITELPSPETSICSALAMPTVTKHQINAIELAALTENVGHGIHGVLVAFTCLMGRLKAELSPAALSFARGIDAWLTEKSGLGGHIVCFAKRQRDSQPTFLEPCMSITRSFPTESSSSVEDRVRPTPEQFRETYDAAFRVWANLHLDAIENPALPASCLVPGDAFGQHPYFPPNLRVQHLGATRHDDGPPPIYATGFSIWGSPPCKGDVPFPLFPQPLEIELATAEPVILSIVRPEQASFNNCQWFVRADTNYIPILVLAWAYILSARWAELLPEACCPLTYTDSQAEHQDDPSQQSRGRRGSYVDVDIGSASLEETRWWAAVLAPGQGWQSRVSGSYLVSPWSLILQPHPWFVVRRANSSSPPSPPSSRPPAVSSSTAIRFLDRFCLRHNVIDQSHAALATVLLFPRLDKEGIWKLSYPKIGAETQPAEVASHEQGPAPERQLRHDWIHQEHRLDQLLTLSCHQRGIRPMLLSVFYDPQVDCNLVSAWLQGTMAAIEAAAHGGPNVLGRMFMGRGPSVAFLWVGATILGLQKGLLTQVRRGEIPADLHSAVWSGTVQSFLQPPVSNPLSVDGCILRADECRLLFLSQSRGLPRGVPSCQWRPFGATPVEDVDLEVRAHEECENHWLQYRGFAWDCIDGECQLQTPEPEPGPRPPPLDLPPAEHLNSGRQITILYDHLDTRTEAASVKATRSVFCWLRLHGQTRHERDIWDHDWFHVPDCDEYGNCRAEDEGGSPSVSDRPISPIKNRMSGLDAASAADISPVRNWLAELDTAGGLEEEEGKEEEGKEEEGKEKGKEKEEEEEK
ncbi:hypothetical protein SODALDRAFT_381310 [Sodiomyces alkalinus F11]|uniref:Uncharacterized protein n=1 Tax=Sodiomyces alkalinus (strain CBS 110278 / VKM F-3762 / F11) TaxID=1314773 RepID=A0A3N2PNH9_SODAK|nr:hypothetical protein SODALDRAFT_381310 [Sodiomyces alkalinus F11]ROT36043.1 hypothetical protein SODALDRAFT_381310 [Sodiomyces alkalinus F11]